MAAFRWRSLGAALILVLAFAGAPALLAALLAETGDPLWRVETDNRAASPVMTPDGGLTPLGAFRAAPAAYRREAKHDMAPACLIDVLEVRPPHRDGSSCACPAGSVARLTDEAAVRAHLAAHGNLANVAIAGATLSGNWNDTDFRCARIGVTSEGKTVAFQDASLVRADFSCARIERMTVTGGEIGGAVFDRATLAGVVMKGLLLSGASMICARIDGFRAEGIRSGGRLFDLRGAFVRDMAITTDNTAYNRVGHTVFGGGDGIAPLVGAMQPDPAETAYGANFLVQGVRATDLDAEGRLTLRLHGANFERARAPLQRIVKTLGENHLAADAARVALRIERLKDLWLRTSLERNPQDTGVALEYAARMTDWSISRHGANRRRVILWLIFLYLAAVCALNLVWWTPWRALRQWASFSSRGSAGQILLAEASGWERRAFASAEIAAHAVLSFPELLITWVAKLAQRLPLRRWNSRTRRSTTALHLIGALAMMLLFWREFVVRVF